MRQSWVIGMVMMYFLLWYCAMMYAGTVTMSSDMVDNFKWLINPEVTNYAGSTIAQVSALTNVGNVIVGLGRVVLLDFPGFWTGYLSWVQVVCYAFTVGMIISIVSVLRGVHAS